MADRDEGPSAKAAPWLAAFRRAADRIAAELASMPPQRRALPVKRGAAGDLTVLVDQVAEELIVAELEALGTPLSLISEELGELDMRGGGPPVVIVDPIDGSLNAKRGMPGFATSMAVADGRTMGSVWLGFVRDLTTGEEHVAERGKGAWLAGTRLLAPRGSSRLELLLVEGTSPRRLGRAARALEGRVGRFRALGSLALSICHTAAGRGDALLGLGGARAFDIAAAQLVAREAGLAVGLPRVEDLEGAPLDLIARRPLVAARDGETLESLLGALP